MSADNCRSKEARPHHWGHLHCWKGQFQQSRQISAKSSYALASWSDSSCSKSMMRLISSCLTTSRSHISDMCQPDQPISIPVCMPETAIFCKCWRNKIKIAKYIIILIKIYYTVLMIVGGAEYFVDLILLSGTSSIIINSFN